MITSLSVYLKPHVPVHTTHTHSAYLIYSIISFIYTKVYLKSTTGHLKVSVMANQETQSYGFAIATTLNDAQKLTPGVVEILLSRPAKYRKHPMLIV